MSASGRLMQFMSLVTILGLLLSSAAPVAHAQESGGGSVYLPVISGGTAAPAVAPRQVNLFRAQVTVRTSAQWQDLIRTGAVVLERGEDWALVLADDAQLTDLARWRFNPEATNSLGTLVNRAVTSAGSNPDAASFGPLLEQIEVANGVAAADAASVCLLYTSPRPRD